MMDIKKILKELPWDEGGGYDPYFVEEAIKKIIIDFESRKGFMMDLDISDLVGMSGEDQLEVIQEELIVEQLDVMVKEIKGDIKNIAEDWYDYNLIEFATDYIRDNL